MKDYLEPEVTFAVLDFLKPVETRHCLESIKRHVKFEHKVIYLHNGPPSSDLTEYSQLFYKERLVDVVVRTRKNNGLGIGTRDLMALCFSPYTVYFQNDQVLARNFELGELENLKLILENPNIKSISLAGATASADTFSERAHFIKTEFYKFMEHSLPLNSYGAGPYHHGVWREGQIQKYYKDNNYLHLTDYPPMAIDIGKWTVRDCAGGRLKMRTDDKSVYWIIPPTEKYVFPEHTDEEWGLAIAGNWPDGKIPQIYIDKKQSFKCWDNLNL